MNFRTPTVTDRRHLENALQEIGKILHMPHFKTKAGATFKLAEINEAILYAPKDGGKAILTHF